jgi:hypothetical protein
MSGTRRTRLDDVQKQRMSIEPAMFTEPVSNRARSHPPPTGWKSIFPARATDCAPAGGSTIFVDNLFCRLRSLAWHSVCKAAGAPHAEIDNRNADALRCMFTQEIASLDPGHARWRRMAMSRIESRPTCLLRPAAPARHSAGLFWRGALWGLLVMIVATSPGNRRARADFLLAGLRSTAHCLLWHSVDFGPSRSARSDCGRNFSIAATGSPRSPTVSAFGPRLR